MVVGHQRLEQARRVAAPRLDHAHKRVAARLARHIDRQHDGVALRVDALGVDVGAALDEHLGDIERALARTKVKRRPVGLVAQIDRVAPLRQNQLHGDGVGRRARRVQRRVANAVGRQRRATLDQQREQLRIARTLAFRRNVLGQIMQRTGAVERRNRHIGATFHQQLANAPMSIARRRQQTRPAGLILRIDVDLLQTQQMLDIFIVAIKCSFV
jgi:hypothetical protein